jgi:hypothetical protein
MQPLMLVTKRQALGQLVFCLGCCCGRTDRGLPAVPVERLKAIWRMEKLNRTVQLSISACLGPCDLLNVALVIFPEGNVWLGGLTSDKEYDELVAWARSCDAEGQLLPLPAGLDAHRFMRFFDQEQDDPLALEPTEART